MSRKLQSPRGRSPKQCVRWHGERWRLRSQVSHTNFLRSTVLAWNARSITGQSPLPKTALPALSAFLAFPAFPGLSANTTFSALPAFPERLYSAGRRSTQGRAASNCAATAQSKPSRPSAETNWNPIGNPAAQYEVLGNDSKRHVRLVRDDRTGRLLISHAAQRLAAMVDRPVPPSSRRRFAVARPSLRGRAVARRAKVAS
jgi:hypothetical protein